MALAIEEIQVGVTFSINGTHTGVPIAAEEASSDTVRLYDKVTGYTSLYTTGNNFADFTIGGVSPSDVKDAVLKINSITNF